MRRLLLLLLLPLTMLVATACRDKGAAAGDGPGDDSSGTDSAPDPSDSGAGGDAGDSGDSGAALPSEGLLITEVMTDNHGTIDDADGDSSDWIELYNQGPELIDIGGFGLSDDPDDPFRATLPARTLAPGAFLVVWASGKTGSVDLDEVHVGFALDSDGEALTLVDATGQLVDSVTVPELREDASWGRPQVVSEVSLLGSGSDALLTLTEEAGWSEVDHDDSAWTPVVLGVGFDTVDGSDSEGNLALFGATSQSTDGYGYTGAQAVDDEWSTFSHTGDGDLDPWWELDLGETSYISTVNLLNRLDCCGERLYNITVEVLDTDGNTVWMSDVLNPVVEGASPTSPGTELDSGLAETVLGRFVRVSKSAVNGSGSSEWMSLAEVQVWGASSAPYAPWIETDIGDQMDGYSTVAWLRAAVPASGLAVTRLTLDVRADDGFIAFLDGSEAARDNMSGDSAAATAVDVEEATGFDLDPALLGEEGALFAVALYDVGDGDALLDLELTAQEIATDAASWVGFDLPTPGEPNGAGIDGWVEDPTADPPRGFYDDPIATTLTTTTAGATQVYTLDGTLPSRENGTVVAPADAATPPVAVVDLSTTSVVRVVAYRDGWADSDPATHTYIYLDDVIRQPAAPDGMPTTWAGSGQTEVAADYEMDPDVVDDPSYTADLLEGLRAIPTLSIVMDPADLWDEDRGIYINSTERGDDWERATSVELILPDGSTGFQEDCGVRIHGYGWRPHTSSKKHSLRLEFSGAYGERKLEYPLFPEAPVERFDSIVLRAQGSRSWQDFRDPSQAQYIRDAFARDTANAMGKAEGQAAYVHLYLNGLYWGLYMPVERPDADFGAERFGGDDSEYDAINRRTSTNEAIDGTLDAYNELLALADLDLLDSANYDAVAAMIDLDDLIDYMLIHQYTTNRDGPEEFESNNMRGLRRRLDGERFRFFVWDMEYSLWYATDDYNIDVDVAGSVSHVYARLRETPAFRARYSERANMHLGEGGALSADACLARWETRALEIEDAIVGESARWGDAARSTPYTRDVEWAEERRRLTEEYFPQRTDVLIEQLQAAGLME
jgi:CotH kinase protein/Lamin Tail Domain/F5/8 type C domain